MAYLVRFSLVATAAVAIGCGGGQTDAAGPDEGSEEPKEEDLVFDEYEAVEIGGTVLQPEGMITVPDVNVRGPKRRKAWGKGRKAYEEGDYAAAAEQYTKLLELYDEDAPPPVKTWVAFVYLRAHQNEKAAELTAEYDAANEELRGHQAYVAAWSAFRAGELERARDFISVAAQKWPSTEGQRAVVSDIVLMTARAGTPLAKADEIISGIVGDNVQQRYVLLFRLHEQYVFAGRYDLASEALAHIRDVVLEGQQLPPADAVGFGYRRSDYEFRMNEPGEAADLAIEAYEGLESCGDACAASGTDEAVIRRLSDLGRVFHTVYATSLDEAFYEPATSLYEAYVAVEGRDDTETVRGYLSNLQQTKENASPLNGKHDAQVMSNVVIARREGIQACYEEALGWEPELGGDLTLTLKVDQAGSVTEVTSEPAAGEEGLGRVADCATERVADWSFPARTLPGTTTLVYPFALSTDAAAAEGATQGPGEAAEAAEGEAEAEG